VPAAWFSELPLAVPTQDEPVPPDMGGRAVREITCDGQGRSSRCEKSRAASCSWRGIRSWIGALAAPS